MEQPMLSLKAVAERLGVGRPVVRRLIAKGTLTAYKVGGRLKMPEDEVRRYLGAVKVGANEVRMK